MKISCIAVDDEPLALEQMKDFIGKITYLELKACFRKGFDALQYLKDNQTDLLFLDIHMDDLSGVQLIRMMKNKPYIILTTAYDQYALEGYELEVSDYLLKPVSFERFVKAVEKINELMRKNSPVTVQAVEAPATQEYIFVKADYRMQKVMIQDIIFIEGYKDYLKLHLEGKRCLVVLMSFRRIEGILPPGRFIRIHKSFLVCIEKIDTIGKNNIRMGEHTLTIGETYKEKFFNVLQQKNLLL